MLNAERGRCHLFEQFVVAFDSGRRPTDRWQGTDDRVIRCLHSRRHLGLARRACAPSAWFGKRQLVLHCRI
jgi:hypothetical protein